MPQLQTSRHLLATSASVIILSYTVLRLLKMLGTKKGSYKTGPAQVGRLVDEKAGADILGPEYDVVIVGGGTSGCVLASRLSEDPSINVLLLEAGESGKARPESVVPGGFTTLFHSKHDYDFYTVEQKNAGGKKKYWPRARLLGGCSSINAMMYHLGAPTDYDEWAKSGQEGSTEWAFKDFQKYFLKFEKFAPSKAYPNVDASLHSTDGPVQVGYFGHFSNYCSKWIEACDNSGIPHAPDVNTIAGTIGATKIMTYIDSKGRRVTTESAYLTPDVLKRPNLTVATQAQVTKIIFDTKDGKKRAVGVEIVRSKDAPRFRVHAKKEIVLSAGAIHSPQILMISGVGPAAHLSSKSIPVIHDLPGVGQHLMDHPVVNVRFRVKRGESLNYLNARNLYEQLRKLYSVLQWQFTGKGAATTNISEAAAFLRSTDTKVFPPESYPEDVEDTTSGENAPDLELLSCPLAWTEHGCGYVPKGDLASMGAVLLRPTSTGSITLNSADPFDKPIIDPNYLATKHDLDVLIRGTKLCLRLARTEPIASLMDKAETDPILDQGLLDSGEANIEQEVRKRVETLYHPTSTARMAPLEEGGVVDPYLRVYGIDGLRVVDASIFPTIIAGHTAAPAIAVAEKAADIIKKQIKQSN